MKPLEGLRVQDLARVMVALQSDVIVENFRPGVAARLGLGPDLRDEKPGLIYASISGFGQSGPDAHLPAYDLVAQAMSGLMAATGEEGGGPLKVGESFGDLMAGLFASWSILAALHHRDRTGEGATLDVTIFDALFALLPTSRALQFYSDRTLPERGSQPGRRWWQSSRKGWTKGGGPCPRLPHHADLRGLLGNST